MAADLYGALATTLEAAAIYDKKKYTIETKEGIGFFGYPIFFLKKRIETIVLADSEFELARLPNDMLNLTIQSRSSATTSTRSIAPWRRIGPPGPSLSEDRRQSKTWHKKMPQVKAHSARPGPSAKVQQRPDPPLVPASFRPALLKATAAPGLALSSAPKVPPWRRANFVSADPMSDGGSPP